VNNESCIRACFYFYYTIIITDLDKNLNKFLPLLAGPLKQVMTHDILEFGKNKKSPEKPLGCAGMTRSGQDDA
jgi:hypothetical protein